MRTRKMPNGIMTGFSVQFWSTPPQKISSHPEKTVNSYIFSVIKYCLNYYFMKTLKKKMYKFQQ